MSDTNEAEKTGVTTANRLKAWISRTKGMRFHVLNAVLIAVLAISIDPYPMSPADLALGALIVGSWVYDAMKYQRKIQKQGAEIERLYEAVGYTLGVSESLGRRAAKAEYHLALSDANKTAYRIDGPAEMQ